MILVMRIVLSLVVVLTLVIASQAQAQTQSNVERVVAHYLPGHSVVWYSASLAQGDPATRTISLHKRYRASALNAPRTRPQDIAFFLVLLSHEMGHLAAEGGVPVGSPNGMGGMTVTADDWDRSEQAATRWGKAHLYGIARLFGYGPHKARVIVRSADWTGWSPDY